MKKSLAILLALVMCLSLAACGGLDSLTAEPQVSILGEWVNAADSEKKIIFNEDSSCEYEGETFKYDVDYDFSLITIYTSTSTNLNLEAEDGNAAKITTFSSIDFYVRPENYEAAHGEYFAAKESQMDERRAQQIASVIGERQELQFGVTYQWANGIDITFSEIITENFTMPYSSDESTNICLVAEVTNTLEESIDTFLLGPDYCRCTILYDDYGVEPNRPLGWYGGMSLWGEGVYEDGTAVEEIPAQETQSVKIVIDSYFDQIAWELRKECYAHIFILDLGGTEYYLNLTELVS